MTYYTYNSAASQLKANKHVALLYCENPTAPAVLSICPFFICLHITLQTGPNYEKKLNPIIQSAIVQAQKEEVRKLVSTEYVKPRECLKDYDKYSMLVSGQAERDVNSFLSQPYSFQEILAKVIHYQNLAEQIQYSSNEVTCLNVGYCYKIGLNHVKEQMSEVSLLPLPPVTIILCATSVSHDRV